jgi:hypothetical protein
VGPPFKVGDAWDAGDAAADEDGAGDVVTEHAEITNIAAISRVRRRKRGLPIGTPCL